MPDLYMDVDTALSEVPVNILPLTDDTDFKTRETGIVYNQAGMDLVWNFITTAGVYTQTAVTPTTAGDYDWTNQGDAMYSIEIPASGGASINNDTEGFGWFSGFCTGVLPWRGPIIGFRAAGINNLMIDSAYSATRGLAGTALPAAAADAAGGLPISDAGGLALDTQLANTHEITAARMGALTDWIDAGRLDAILDAIKAVTDNLATASQVAATVVDEWETQSQADPTGFHVNVKEVDGTAQTANDNGADINTLLTRIVGTLAAGTHNPQSGDAYAIVNNVTYGNSAIESLVDELETRLSAIRAGYLDNLSAGAVAQASVCTEGRLSELDAANLPTDIADIPTVAEFNARTLLAENYFDPTADTVVNVTNCANNADMRGTDNASLASVCTEGRLGELDAVNIPANIDSLNTKIGTNVDTAGTTTVFSRLRQIVDTYLSDGTIGLAQIESLVDELETRLTSDRAGYIDNLNGHTAQTGDNFSRIGVNGIGLSAIPWNDSWDTEIQEVMPDLINNEIVDALNVDTYTEPGQEEPAVTASIVTKIGYLYKSWRNKKDNDGTTTKIYADNGTTVDQKSTVSEVDGTVTVGEMESGE